ncbi:hypothetical protein AAFF_G00429270 [Aldrovandia affinis]|uniref:Ricin B lectin domain-containing protein n=1 Tax=Aldrovandia affinis TaxID=143900 RepID=A0AAD7S988_9TELE|nr:hypothetical protein AAFF_G00429270 [Aldrovandia affinis]
MVYHALHGLCLQDSRESDRVQVRRCDLDSDLQQWRWESHRFLVNEGTARCLSSQRADHVLTAACDGSDRLWWDCDRHRLISHDSPLQLSTDGRSLFLSQDTKLSKWRSLGEATICQQNLRSKRLSDEPDVSPTEEYDYEEEEGLTEEQRFLRWYYRTEDPAPWKYAMLALSSAALLLGCLLFGMGTMAGWNRKKIGHYKAAAAALKSEEVQGTFAFKQPDHKPRPLETPDHKLHPLETGEHKPRPLDRYETGEHKPRPLDRYETGELRTGDVILTWKDGTVSTLYADAPEDDV